MITGRRSLLWLFKLQLNTFGILIKYLIHRVAEKMIKSPRNIKYTKYQKNYTHSRGTPAKRNTSVDFGTYGLQCNEPTLLSLKQLETCRRTLRRVVARRAPI